MAVILKVSCVERECKTTGYVFFRPVLKLIEEHRTIYNKEFLKRFRNLDKAIDYSLNEARKELRQCINGKEQLIEYGIPTDLLKEPEIIVDKTKNNVITPFVRESFFKNLIESDLKFEKIKKQNKNKTECFDYSFSEDNVSERELLEEDF